MLDTLKLARRLTASGMPAAQAEALADEVNDGLKSAAVTKSDLTAALSRLRAELIIWQIGTAFALFVSLKYLH